MEPEQQQEISISQVLPKEFVRHVDLDPYFVGKVDKKNAHHVTKLLRGIHQPHEFEFLKRVRPMVGDSVEILLCRRENELVLEQIKKALEGNLQEIFIRDAPRWAPLTKEQHKEWNGHWPTAFSQNDFEIVKHSKKEIKLLTDIAKDMGDDELVLFTTDGKLIGGKGGCPKNSVLHGVIRLLEEWPESEAFKTRKHHTRHLDDPDQVESEQYYYFTGIYLLARQKVCQMCAMALLHSRLRRLYYISEAEDYAIDEIAYNKRLNHQYSLIRLKWQSV